ncbi:hypothetical protein EC845_1352 [Comamonas sp. BIGb0124]|uniref:hypothetical protein n=1 Tax=Comamonas sp. BIGb0124 TaxID=2485130 RepID=UPI000FB098BE|nr:hypothetical protein [Comamonas sp. BIGb0124]ROR22456.1 hypothetical protein EC845_1352 [Comamonas sp. BIGb0124]
MVVEPKTKQSALETLEALRQEVVQKMEDKDIAALMSAEFLQSVFNEAWRLQFEDDVLQFQRAARDLVTETANQPQNGVS